MTVLLAVTAVGVGSLAFRLVPLLGAHRLPDKLARVAGWAGLSVVTGLALAYRGRSVLVSVAMGAATYLCLTAVLAAI